MDLGLKDAHVVVMGASRGLGRATARRFAAEGAKVALLARHTGGLAKTAAQCRDAGSPDVLAIGADMADSAQIDAAFAEIGERWGSLNVLVNNAANSLGTQGTFQSQNDDAYMDAFNRITLGYARTVRAALPLMKAAQWARIVNLSATSTHKATPNLHIFNMTKMAMVTMSRSLAKEFAPDGILVNVVSPAGIMVEGGNWGEPINSRFKELGLDPDNPYDAPTVMSGKSGSSSEGAWLVRYGLVDEYAAVIAFAGSKTNSYMTGTEINVDGGSNF